MADPIAEKLNADADVLVPRKLRSSYNSDNALGAIMHDDSLYSDSSILETQNDISNEYISFLLSFYTPPSATWIEYLILTPRIIE